jgi:hypothetical protein
MIRNFMKLVVGVWYKFRVESTSGKGLPRRLRESLLDFVSREISRETNDPRTHNPAKVLFSVFGHT